MTFVTKVCLSAQSSHFGLAHFKHFKFVDGLFNSVVRKILVIFLNEKSGFQIRLTVMSVSGSRN